VTINFSWTRSMELVS